MTTKAIIGQDICEVCQKISLESLLAAEGFEHISDPNLLSNSSQKCRMCSLIRGSGDVFLGRAVDHWYAASDSPRFTILRGLEGENLGLDHILVCFGFVKNAFDYRGDGSIIPPGTVMIGRLEVSAEDRKLAQLYLFNMVYENLK